jgi:S1-C subfamily serine protease
MYRSSLFLTATLLGTNMALVQQVAMAKSAVEVGAIATAITVEVKSFRDSKAGSGILLQQQGEIYTILTAAHVVSGVDDVKIKTADGEVHRSVAGSIKRANNSVDLAVVKFKSNKSYKGELVVIHGQGDRSGTNGEGEKTANNSWAVKLDKAFNRSRSVSQ